MKRHLLMWGTAALIGSMLTACSGGGGGLDLGGANIIPGSSMVSGVVFKGPINAGKVNVYAVNPDGTKGALLGSGTTASDGTGAYSVDIGSYTGDVLVEVTGGTYKDEATGITKPNATLRAALTGTSGNVTVAVTPFTELAVKKVGNLLTKAAIENANALVSVIAGVDIIGTIPVDVSTTSSVTSIDKTTYGLALAAISEMSSTGSTVDQVLEKIKADLADDGIAQTAAPELKTALQSFINSPENKSIVKNVTQTSLNSSLDFITTTAIKIDTGSTSDVDKAKKLVADLRNTVMSVANYKGVGAPGMIEGPFNRLSTELSTEVNPALAATTGKLSWIISSCTSFLKGNPWPPMDAAGNGLFLTQSGSTVNFEVRDQSNNVIDSGSLTVDDLVTPTSGAFTGNLTTPTGNATVNVDYTGTLTNGLISGVKFTGTMTTPEFNFDFSQAGRELAVTLAQVPGQTGGNYPSSISFAGRIVTKTARFDGSLSISTVWAEKQHSYYDYWSGQQVCMGDMVPSAGTFNGLFAERNNGTDSGMTLAGKIDANFYNAATFDGCAPISPTNFRKYDASFDGKITAPNRPTVTAHLHLAESEQGIVKGGANYIRTNTDGTVVSLMGSLESNESTNTVQYTFTNQDLLKLNINIDENKATCYERLSGSITTQGGASLAEIHDNCATKVKYSDGYFESVF